MSLSADRPNPLTVQLRWDRAVQAAWLNLAAQIGIVATGGLVRLTGSGLGCPSWPQCVPGSVTPVVAQAEGSHKYIEFGNRTLTGVVLVASILVMTSIVVTLRGMPEPGRAVRPLLTLAAMPLVLTLTQALLGGVTVLTDLSPITVAAHMLVSMVAIAVSTVLLLRVRELAAGRRPPISTLRGHVPLGTALAVVAAVVLVLGTVVTGSGPHSGDADQPARFGFDLSTVSRVHALAVWSFVALLLITAFSLRDRPDPLLAGRLRMLGLLVAAQAMLGYAQYALKLPWQLVAVHVLLAALFAATVTVVVDPLQRRAVTKS